jgi:hypothetical protein
MVQTLTNRLKIGPNLDSRALVAADSPDIQANPHPQIA